MSQVTDEAGGAPQRAELAEHLIKLFLAALSIALTGFVVWDATHPTARAFAFTRVAGPTRVETALAASRFWLSPIDRKPVPIPSTSARSGHVLDPTWAALGCAVVDDAPVLFPPTTPAQERATEERTTVLAPGVQKEPDTEGCSPQGEDGWWVFDHGDGGCLLPPCPGDRPGAPPPRCAEGVTAPEWLPHRKRLAGTVVFVVPHSRCDVPDLAVGIALASHLAKQDGGTDVSVVVLPRYLESWPALERALEGAEGSVTGGVVIGGTEILPEDMRSLLRAVVPVPGRGAFLGELRANLGPFGEALIALAALLFGAQQVAKSAPVVARELARNGPRPAGVASLLANPLPLLPVPSPADFLPPFRRNTMAKSTELQGMPAWFAKEFAGSKVTVVMRNGESYTGEACGLAALPEGSSAYVLALHEGDPREGTAVRRLLPLADIAQFSSHPLTPPPTAGPASSSR